ncbi:MAG: tRNA (adenosine(37)-N6)-threonylcarbamoyltransferase complex dimerization subunit type 1 TsaB [Bacteroidales bacterium]|nr:tRNA (adenosine(37)-N6)-threonylcarbamoyltransferase complex dimerization subunit type 1 TsaB [Bacteroidales bacterium]
MPRLVFIETSTALCSTALAENGRIISTRKSSEPRAHASLTAVFVKEMLDEAGWKVSNLDAVCVSKGPGSYTGLRVGVSTAKGLCFGGGVPLIAVDTLEILAHQAIEVGLPEGCKAILPMVDARRMEVYTAVFSPAGERLGDIAPVVLDANSFADLFASGPVVVIGDAAEKFKNCHSEPIPCHSEPTPCHSERSEGISFIQTCPEASAMLVPAMAKFAKKEFEDVAYFEPFYLKQFIATTPKKLF